MGRELKRGWNAPGAWVLKFVILTASAAVFTTIFDQIAASILLWLTTLTAMSVATRKWGRPFFRKYMKPQARLSDHMDKMEQGLADLQQQQGAIKGELGAVKAKVDHVETDIGGIKLSSQAAREDARSALAVADAVRRKLGIPDEP